MPDKEGQWEQRWTAALRDGQDEGVLGCSAEEAALSPEEERMAKKLWAHMRHMAGNKEKGNAAPYLVRNDGSYYKPDYRRIDHQHSVSWMQVEHHGTYWEVAWGSKEFSSSFSTFGRGRTLAEAMQAAEENQ